MARLRCVSCRAPISDQLVHVLAWLGNAPDALPLSCDRCLAALTPLRCGMCGAPAPEQTAALAWLTYPVGAHALRCDRCGPRRPATTFPVRASGGGSR